MRHGKLRGQLGVNDARREAMLRNLLSSLLKHERIHTTVARAKQLKRYADSVIELGKTDNWQSKRKVRVQVHDKEALTKLFTIYGPRFKERRGGYTRIFRVGQRRGDNAAMSLIEILPDPSKENEPRIIRAKKPKTEEEQLAAEQKKKEAKKQRKQEEAEQRKKEKLKVKAETKRTKKKEDIDHSHKSQQRKSDMGTGRAKGSKKGLS